RGAPSRRHIDKLLDMIHALLAHGGIGGGEVVAYTRAADCDAHVGRLLTQVIDIGVGWDGGITREVVRGCVETFELGRGGEIEELQQRRALATPPSGIVEQLVEGI